MHNTPQAVCSEVAAAIETEARAHGFDEAATRWLTLLLEHDSSLPAPTAGAMVKRVRRLPIGQDLASLDDALQALKRRETDDMTTSERRVTAALLRAMLSQANALLVHVT